MRREAAFYQALGSGPPLALAALVPGFVAYDADTATIVLELLCDHDTMAARCRDVAAEHFPISAWRAVGAALAAIHHPHVSVALAPATDCLMPSVFMLDRPPLEILRTISPAGLTVLKVVQQSEVICQALERVRTSWSASAFTHGDIRAENLLYRAPADIHIIDWELSGLGDAAWDVACAVAEIVCLWLRGRRRRYEPPATGDWVVFQAAIHALWTAYREAAPSTNMSAQVVSLLSAVRMLQSAFEASAGHSVPTPTAVLLLQIAVNVLTDLQAAAAHFFALTPAHRSEC